MRARAIAIVVLLSVLGGCSAIVRRHRGAAIAADVTAAVGVAAIVASEVPCESDDGLTISFDCIRQPLMLLGGGTLLTMAGLAGVVLLAVEASGPGSP
jgi:hypothetical protein